jgi:hypothetical protein
MAESAERQDDTGLTFLHDEEAAYQPQEQNDDGHDRNACARATHIRAKAAAGIATAATLAEQAAQPLVEVAPQFIEIGRTFLGLSAILVLGPIVLLAAPPTRIVQRKLQADFF